MRPWTSCQSQSVRVEHLSVVRRRRLCSQMVPVLRHSWTARSWLVSPVSLSATSHRTNQHAGTVTASVRLQTVGACGRQRCAHLPNLCSSVFDVSHPFVPHLDCSLSLWLFFSLASVHPLGSGHAVHWSYGRHPPPISSVRGLQTEGVGSSPVVRASGGGSVRCHYPQVF